MCNNYFFKMIELKYLPCPDLVTVRIHFDERTSKDCDFTPFYSIIAENISKSSKSKFLKIFYLRKFWTFKPIYIP